MRKPAVFLDRDGVLTEEKGYICPVNEIRIFPYVAECVKIIKEKGYWAIVVTNQSGIARGLYEEQELLQLHQELKKKTGVDAIYYCPHYEQGIVKRYAIACECRKPKLGLMIQACLDFEIDMSLSYMVGDRETDIEMGQKAGLKTVLVQSVYEAQALEKVRPEYIVRNLQEFVKIL